MVTLGVHTNLWRGTAAAVAAAVRGHSLACVQLAPGFPGLRFHDPGDVTSDRCRRAAEPFHAAGLAVAALSGPGCILDPDLDRRHQGIVRWLAFIRHAHDFGTGKVVAATGGGHVPGGVAPPGRPAAAWAELCWVLREALAVAADHGVTLLLKPQPGHLLADVGDAEDLLVQLDHPSLGFVMDPAGFLAGVTPEALDEELDRLCNVLGPRAPLAHARDLRPAPHGTAAPCAGGGALAYATFFRHFRRYQPCAAVIMEHLRPHETAAARAHLEHAWQTRAVG